MCYRSQTISERGIVGDGIIITISNLPIEVELYNNSIMDISR